MNEAAVPLPDELEIQPLTRPPEAVVEVPGSKSLTNRALLVAALADGVSELTGALDGDDTRHFAAGLRALGFRLEPPDPAPVWRVHGEGGRVPAEHAELFVGNAGTAARFLTALCCLGSGVYRIDGVARMRERPMEPLLEALRSLGAEVRSLRQSGNLPVEVEAGGLDGGVVALDARDSSQFLSALLLVAPYARSDVEIMLIGDPPSQPYVTMTTQLMRAFGVEVEQPYDGQFFVRAGQRYRARRFAIEPDASSASYFYAAAAITGGSVVVRGIHEQSLQGDARFPELLREMGCRVQRTGEGIRVTGPEGGRLRGLDIDLSDMSDLTPTVAVMAPFCDAPVRLRNVAHVRLQESDRLRVLATELGRLGVRVEEFRDGLRIYPGPVSGGLVQPHDDHRIAMAFAVLGLRVRGIRIANPGCVSKTFPDFFQRLERLRGEA